MALPSISKYMVTELHTFTPQMNIYDAVAQLIEKRISGAPVVDGVHGTLVGVLSEFDCLTLLSKGQDHQRPSGTVADFMSTDVETISSDMDIYWVAGKFMGCSYRRFPVVDSGRLVGQVSRRDILRAIQEHIRPEDD